MFENIATLIIGIDTIKKGIKFSLDSPRGNFIVLSDSQYSAWNQWEIKFTTYNTVAILRKGTTISSATYKAEEGKQVIKNLYLYILHYLWFYSSLFSFEYSRVRRIDENRAYRWTFLAENVSPICQILLWYESYYAMNQTVQIKRST